MFFNNVWVLDQLVILKLYLGVEICKAQSAVVSLSLVLHGIEMLTQFFFCPEFYFAITAVKV